MYDGTSGASICTIYNGIGRNVRLNSVVSDEAMPIAASTNRDSLESARKSGQRFIAVCKLLVQARMPENRP